MKNSWFLFKGYEEDLEKGEVLFHFVIESEDRAIDFTEKISFPSVASKIPPILLKSILNNLMLILGISYWKTYCPKEIVIEGNFLTYEQANFWNIVYTKGLGEFFYKNKIDFRGLVNFPSAKSGTVQNPTKQNSEKIISFPRQNRSLVPIGGGKDSIVSAELLKENGKQFDVLTSSFPIQIEVSKIIGKKAIHTNREIDPKLLELNKEKGSLPGGRQVYNGHIPISVFYAFLSLLIAALFDYEYIIVSNERSANYGNVEYLGEVINHQWSKSEEFEKMFQDYVAKFITKDIHYFSLLRPLSEIKIIELFSEHKQYFGIFSSCNSNFKVSAPLRSDELRRGKWCGKCAKCLFVFTLFSGFLSKNEILGIFGQNLFGKETLLKPFKELLGLENFKPFECVGTPEEMKLALCLARKKGEFNNDFLMKVFLKEIPLSTLNVEELRKDLFSKGNSAIQNLIPYEFKNIINNL